MSQRALIFLPDIPERSHIRFIEQSLLFLRDKNFELMFIDPYDYHCALDNQAFYEQWQKRLAGWCQEYDVFIGFSYGGVILQQCIGLLEQVEKPVILFSSPAFADELLKQKLGHVIELCQQDKLSEALITLYQWVYPSTVDIEKMVQVQNKHEGIDRVVSGLKRVLSTDSRSKINHSTLKYIHLIGEYSKLVTDAVVSVGPKGQLIRVPSAGMRVLKDNPEFCQSIILDHLA